MQPHHRSTPVLQIPRSQELTAVPDQVQVWVSVWVPESERAKLQMSPPTRNESVLEYRTTHL